MSEQLVDNLLPEHHWPEDISLPGEYLHLQTIARLREKPRDIIPGVCFENSVGMLVAAPYAGKTLLLLDLGLALACQQQWLKWMPVVRTPVLIYALDSPGWTTKEQTNCLMAGRGIDPDHGYDSHGETYPYPFALVTREAAKKQFGGSANIMNPGVYARIKEDALAFGAKVIGIDSFSKIHPFDEIKRAEMEAVMTRLEDLARETQAFVLVLHHTPVGGDGRSDGVYAGRGSSVIAASLDFLGVLTKDGRRECKLDIQKGRGSDEEGVYTLVKERVPDHPTEPRAVRWVLAPPKPKKIPQAEVVWNCIVGELADNMLRSKAELTQAAFDVGVTVDIGNYLSRFVAQGLLKVPQRGHYMLTGKGKQQS